jgi:DNA-directed RNA polymerase specialized sigma subunit
MSTAAAPARNNPTMQSNQNAKRDAIVLEHLPLVRAIAIRVP